MIPERHNLTTTERLILGMANPQVVSRWAIQVEEVAGSTWDGTVEIQRRIGEFTTNDVPQLPSAGQDAAWYDSAYTLISDEASTSGDLTAGIVGAQMVVQSDGFDVSLNVSVHTAGQLTVYARPLVG